MRVTALRSGFLRVAAGAVIAGIPLLGATAIAHAAPVGAPLPAFDPGCDYFGALHPMCAGGAWADESASKEFGPPSNPFANLPDNGGQMVPNVDGSLSLPGTPGAI